MKWAWQKPLVPPAGIVPVLGKPDSTRAFWRVCCLPDEYVAAKGTRLRLTAIALRGALAGLDSDLVLDARSSAAAPSECLRVPLAVFREMNAPFPDPFPDLHEKLDALMDRMQSFFTALHERPQAAAAARALDSSLVADAMRLSVAVQGLAAARFQFAPAVLDGFRVRLDPAPAVPPSDLRVLVVGQQTLPVGRP